MIVFYGILIVVLTFLYWLLQEGLVYIFRKESQIKLIRKNFFFIWFILVGLIAVLLGVSLGLPRTWLSLSDHILLVALIIPFMLNSNYRPHNSLKGFIAFCLVFPIGEELIFRGAIPMIISAHFPTINVMIPFPLLREISFAVLMSALLFGIMHLQYFKFKVNRDTMKKVIFAFVFGVVLGNVAEMTNSLFYPIIFHVLANTGATYFYYNRTIKHRTQ